MIRRCRLCAEDDVLKPQLTLDGSSALGEPFTLSRCEECGTWQVDPPLHPDFIKTYFQAPERWKPSTDPDGNTVDPIERSAARLKEYKQYADVLVKYLEASCRVLDVGAGSGLMLSLLPESFNRIAVEPHPDAADAAMSQGLIVMREWAEDLSFPVESFGGMIMNQTFDHLHDPGGFLSKAVHWIKPGGFVLFTGLINPESLIPRLYGPRFRLWHPLYQIYPPPRSMVLVLGSHGFEIVKWWQPYMGTPYGGMLKLLRDVPEVIIQALGLGGSKISPAWPGNTYSLLARKTLLLKRLRNPSQKWGWIYNQSPAPLKSHATRDFLKNNKRLT